MKVEDPHKNSSKMFLARVLTEIVSEVRQSIIDSLLVRISLALLAALIVYYLWTRGLDNILTTNGFGPHGECLLWLPGLITLYVGSDSLIGLAYVAISATLIYLVYTARHSMPFQWVFVAFGIFIIACGTTHFLDILTLWVPAYWLLGLVKLLTALASVTTALILPPLVPRVLALIHLARLSDERQRQLAQAHSELEALYAKSQDLDRLKAGFFANVSHELRTPLTLILGPTQTLLATHQLTEEQQHILEVVQRNALTLFKHVNDLLALAQLEMGQMALNISEVDLAQQLQVSAAHFEALAQDHQLTFLVESPPCVPACLDAEKLQRICLNLLSNAFKFTPPGGTVRCVLSQGEGWGIIKVQDSGPGVRPELRQAIFERFRQGEDNQARHVGGAGLGLAIVKEFVELHGGTVTVSEAAGGGACFSVELPLAQYLMTDRESEKKPMPLPIAYEARDENRIMSSGFVPRAATPTQPLSPIAEEQIFPLLAALSLQPESDEETVSQSVQTQTEGQRALVLVIEDHRDMARFLAETLAPEYRVIMARDGQDGLEKALTLQPDLILCDVMMPRMGGEQFVGQVRTHRILDTTPIMILSAWADDTLRIQLLRGGVQEYLVKPSFPEELRVRVANLIAIKQARQVLQQEVEIQNQSLVLLAREVTLRKRESQQTLAALQQANEQLTRASQVQRNFVAIVSHEFRTALTSIQGFSGLMSDETFTPEEVKEYAADIHTQAERLSRMIADLLDLERMKSGRMPLTLEHVDLNALIREVIEYIRPTTPMHTFELQLDSTLPSCIGNRDKLTQVVSNLISNAIKYSPHGGTILVRSQMMQGMVQVGVQDNGIGIPPEALEDVFDPYCRIEAGTTRYIQGTGLGLSIVRQIIQMHGGQVWVESSLGKGSRFHFTVPLTSQQLRE